MAGSEGSCEAFTGTPKRWVGMSIRIGSSDVGGLDCASGALNMTASTPSTVPAPMASVLACHRRCEEKLSMRVSRSRESGFEAANPPSPRAVRATAYRRVSSSSESGAARWVSTAIAVWVDIAPAPADGQDFRTADAEVVQYAVRQAAQGVFVLATPALRVQEAPGEAQRREPGGPVVRCECPRRALGVSLGVSLGLGLGLGSGGAGRSDR